MVRSVSRNVRERDLVHTQRARCTFRSFQFNENNGYRRCRHITYIDPVLRDRQLPAAITILPILARIDCPLFTFSVLRWCVRAFAAIQWSSGPAFPWRIICIIFGSSRRSNLDGSFFGVAFRRLSFPYSMRSRTIILRCEMQ